MNGKPLDNALMMRAARSLPESAPDGMRCTVDGIEFVYDATNSTWVAGNTPESSDSPCAATESDMVNHPKHYLNTNAIIELNEHECFERDGKMYRPVECIELMRRIKDPRIATVFKYVWRIAFGGKFDDDEDAGKGVFYLQDFVGHKVD